MRPTHNLLFCITLCLLLAGCSQPTTAVSTAQSDGALETMVAATLTAAAPIPTDTSLPPTQTAAPSATSVPQASPTASPSPSATAVEENVSGKVCYPGGDVPAMTLYFQETGSQAVKEVKIQAGDSSYKVHLDPGRYQAYAWLDDFSRGGLYSQAVPCGLQTSCKDHSALEFEVKSGEKLDAIDLCDWYVGPFDVPYPPGKDANSIKGNISGGIDYPGGAAPALKIVFFNQSTGNWLWVSTLPGAASYSSSVIGLAPGTYTVVAYQDGGTPGGYADANHQLITVTVKAGEMTTGIDINDWSLPQGSYPPDPTQ